MALSLPTSWQPRRCVALSTGHGRRGTRDAAPQYGCGIVIVEVES